MIKVSTTHQVVKTMVWK